MERVQITQSKNQIKLSQWLLGLYIFPPWSPWALPVLWQFLWGGSALPQCTEREIGNEERRSWGRGEFCKYLKCWWICTTTEQQHIRKSLPETWSRFSDSFNSVGALWVEIAIPSSNLTHQHENRSPGGLRQRGIALCVQHSTARRNWAFWIGLTIVWQIPWFY